MARLYNKSRWRDIEQPRQLRQEPFCRMCGPRKPTSATVVDHIIPHGNKPKLFWDRDNLQSLCKKCHDTKTFYESNRSKYLPLSVKPIADDIILLCGPPSSGKSTWANKQTGYTVIDLDTIKCEVSGQPIYEVEKKYLSQSIAIRNKRISETKGKIIIIATLANNTVRAKWQEHLSAKLFIMSTCEYDCIKRINQDDRRKDKRMHIALVKGYFKTYSPICGEQYI